MGLAYRMIAANINAGEQAEVESWLM